MALAVTAALVFAGCHRDDTPTPPPAPPVSVNPTPLVPRAKTVIYVVNPKATGDQDPLMPQAITLKHPDSPARDAVEALLQSKDSPMPTGTALRGITIDNSIATLDFSQSPVNETGGEGGQSAALTALGRTLGQFPEITQYQIEVKGALVKTFGEFTTDGPMDVVRPDAVSTVQQAKGDGQ